MKTRKSRTTTGKSTASATSNGKQIAAWENDPFGQAVPTNPPNPVRPILRPVPSLKTTVPLPVGIRETQPPPQVYPTGTPEFRYWTAAEALRRAADFWSSLLPGTKWHKTVGKVLNARLDAGEDFNAFYDRQGLEFFHGNVAGQTFFSGESPDVVCHELGHAVLDALRPQLFNVGFIEAAAFHESFGDMSALLSALQLQSVREHVLVETHGRLARSSSLSRLAEQLGFAIRQIQPDAVERNSLRNAANRFFYRDPSTLPPDAPATQLSSEPHSFSRVFTGAFLDVLAGMLKVASGSNMATETQLLDVSQRVGKYLVTGILQAAVVPAYYSQVAAAMVHNASEADRNAVAGAFAHHGILSLSAAASAAAGTAAAGVAAAPAAKGDDLGTIALSGAEYGLQAESLLVHAEAEPHRFQASPAVFGIVAGAPPSSDQAAKHFLEDLLQLGRVHIEPAEKTGGAAFAHALSQPHKTKTHMLSKEAKGFRLRRLRFDCGFDCDCYGA